MKKAIIISLLFLLQYSVEGQQEQLYTQFMFNKMAMNPAYAGNDEMYSITAIHRNQWTGFDGAPETQLLSLNAPVGRRVGLGLNVARNTIGISERLTIDGIYAYRFPFASGQLSIGAQVSARRLTVDYTDPALFAINGITEDQAIEFRRFDKNLINFGAGAYFNSDKFYMGISIPRMFNAKIDFDNNLLDSEEVVHLYLMSGFELKLSEKIRFMPQLLFKTAQRTPADFDFNFSFSFNEIVYTGVTIRTGGQDDIVGESIDFIAGIQINKQALLSFAYDYTLSDIGKYENGSLEFLLSYRFKGKGEKSEPTNPRYF